MRKYLVLIICFMGMFISNCSSSHMLVKNETIDLHSQPKKAVLIIIRPRVFYGCGQLFSVFMDKKMIGECASGTYYRTEIEPGIHDIFVKLHLGNENSDLNINQKQFEEDNVYYLVLYIYGAFGALAVKGEFKNSYQEAKEHMEGCIYMEYNKKKPGDDYIPEVKKKAKEENYYNNELQ